MGRSSHIDVRISADGLANPNMTNLAIKGIIGVKAMAEMSRAVQRDPDAERYDVRWICSPKSRL